MGPRYDPHVTDIARSRGIDLRESRVLLHLWHQAVRRAEAVSQDKMSAITAGMPLPLGMKLPF